MLKKNYIMLIKMRLKYTNCWNTLQSRDVMQRCCCSGALCCQKFDFTCCRVPVQASSVVAHQRSLSLFSLFLCYSMNCKL